MKAGVKRTRDTNNTNHYIIGDSLETETESNVIKLPKLDSLKRTVRRERQTMNAAPVQPEILQDLVIPPEYQITEKGDNFLLYDSGRGIQRVIIFGTKCNVEMLNGFQIGLAGGTFKTAPSQFPQVYTIHGLRGGPNPLQDGHLLPSLFVLLPNKTGMWQQINLCVQQLSQPI